MKIFETVSSKYHSLSAFLKRCNFTGIAFADSKLLNLIELFTWFDLLYLKNTRTKLQELNTGTEVSV